MVYLKSVENVITLGKLIGLLFLFCLPLLSILFLKTKRNDLARPVMGTIFLVESERAKRTHCCSLIEILLYIYIYSVTKILRKIRATTFTENYGKLRVRGMSAWDERTPFPISLGSATLYLFATR